jgi:tRNA A-37 threonylcarbamoyl transferase component Bud32
MVAAVARIAGGVRLAPHGPTSLVASSADPADAFERLWSRLRRFDGTNASTFLEVDGGLFLKGQRLPAILTPSAIAQSGRTLREVRNLKALHDAGLPVPQVVLHGAEWRLGVPTRSIVVLRRIAGAQSLREVLQGTAPEGRTDVWAPLGRVVARMHAIGFVHRDLTARNVLVQRADGQVRIHLIDCPRGEFARRAGRLARRRREDYFRLGRSVLDLGGTESEVRTLFAACGFAEADAAIEMIGISRRAGGARPLRTRIWVAFGL